MLLIPWMTLGGADQFNLQRLHESPDDGRGVRQQLATGRREVAELERQLAKITDALLADDSGAAPLAFVRRARELEQQLGGAQDQVRQAEREIAARSNNVEPAQAARWADLASQVEAGDYAAREQVRQLVMDTFERIVVYMRGIGDEGRKSKNIDVMLVPKAGRPLLLRVDRRSGVWVSSEGPID